MSGGGGTTQTTSTVNNDPWSGAQPYIKDVLNNAQKAYQSGKGFDYPNFPTTIPFAPETTQALQGIEGKANQGNPLGAASNSAAMGILGNNGLTPFQQQAGSDVAGYSRGDYVNGGSPEFNKALDTQAAKLGTDVQRNVDAMGRSGSAYNTNELATQIGDFRNNALQQEMAREQGLQLQGAGLMSGIGQSGAGNLAQFSGLAPSIYEQGFSPYSKLADVGSAYQDQSTRQMQENIDRFNATQQQPWASLAAYNGLIGGAGQLGSTTQTKVPAPSPLQGALGGALSGASLGSSIMPGWGTLAGAIGGGLLGGFF